MALGEGIRWALELDRAAAHAVVSCMVIIGALGSSSRDMGLGLASAR
jgi:hypothetical protein